MNEFTPLARPSQTQITIDSVAKDCPSDGFNYPTFRQLAKNARLLLSTPLNTQVATSYHRLLAVANSKGWFVAVKTPSSGSGSELIFSPLDELRAASEAAKPDEETLFTPKRIVSIPTRAHIVSFACGDTKLLVGLDDGSVVVYDTSSLFTPGTNDVQPLGRNQVQSSPLRQVLPNPGTEPNLSELVAVVGDGKVELLNMQLESQGGWVASDLMTQPIAVDWSPKGKHIAIGLQTGDILTYSTTNKSTPHKHIPPTVDSILVSLNWLGPGHTFRTSYAAQDGSPTQHIVILDIKSSAATYFAPDHPFLCSDRTYQAAYILNFPKWDVDSATSEENKYLTVVGDFASVDLEILGNVGNQWYRQSQDNPLTLPLDKELNDTMLVALEADLTDPRYDSPIMYAYLNDGSLQGWYVEHTKPYLGMMNGKILGSGEASAQMSTEVQEKSKDSDMGTSTFGSGPVSTFGQSSFGQQPAQSAFGASSTPAFGQTGFGQQSSASTAFGSATPAFGKSSFGQPSTFGAASGGFGQPSNQASTTTSTFGGGASSGGFAAFSSGSGAFGQGGAFGSGGFSSTPSTSAFGSLGSNSSSNVFGQGSFGAPATTPSQSESQSNSTMTREASMSDSTPAFGGLTLGSAHPTDPNTVNSMFGSFSAPSNSSTQQTSSSFGSGSLLKPATGFGAFGNLPANSAFAAPKPATNVSAFAPVQSNNQTSTPSTASPAFGQSGFGQPSFGKPSFGAASGTSAFGAFGNAAQAQKPVTTTPAGSFSAFASAPTTFGSALGSTTNSAESKPAAGGFSAFASATPSAFGSPAKANESKPPSSGGGFSAFASATPSPFATAPNTSSAFGGGFSAFASATPAFGSTSSTTDTAKSSTSSSSVSSTPAAEPKPRTTVFGTPTKPAAEGSSSVFGTSTIRSSLAKGDDSPVGSPKIPSLDTSPPSSPESKPATVPAFAKQDGKSPSPFGSGGTISPSPLGQGAFSSPVPSGGAFGNIQVTPSAFKPAAGFGAFGSGETPKSSAFFKKPDETPPPVSAFASISTTPKTPVTTTASPAFGATSALGGPKSVFAPVPSPETTPTKAPAAGGFSAFSGAPSGFSAFAGPKSSFTDLLKSKGDEATDPVKPAATPVFSKPEAESSKPVASVFATLSAIENEKDKNKSSTSGSKDDDKKTPKMIPNEPSYGNLSLSASSSGSFVEVGANQDEDAEVEEGEVSDEDGEHSDFLSDNFDESSYKDGDSANEESDEDDLPEERNTPSPEPPLPASRSPSATPQPEVPTIEFSGDADDEGSASPSPKASAREASTTPPTTPAKDPKAAFGSSPSLATPVGSSSASPFGIGMGRPSTRPVRSSPLANAVSAEDEEDEHKKSPPKAKAKPAVSPKPVFGVLPVESKGKGKDEEEPTADTSPTTKRPKTPPLLSTMGPPPTPSPFLTPSITKASSSSSDSASSKPGPSTNLPFSLGNKPASVSAPSLFGGIPKATAGDTPVSSWTSTTPSKPELTRAATSPPAPGTPMPSLFGGSSFFAPPPPLLKSPTPAFSMPPFSLSGATAASPIPAGGSSIFGSKSAPVSPPPGQGLFGATATSPPQPSSFFGIKPPAAGGLANTPNLFGSMQLPTSPPFSLQVPAKVPPKPSPESILEEGMQKECTALVTMIVDDLAELPVHGKKLEEALKQAGTLIGGSRNIRDLGVQAKWSLGDLTQFKKLLLQYESVLDEMEATHEKEKQAERDLQSSVLKCGTRKEEIARFHKARDDKDFAKMLKSRTLGPEHSETQTHLRKNIRAIRDRVQKLESRLQESKKKLAQAASCKPTIKAPSLDTINRTYRNIEIAIDQQADEVSLLAARISKLNVDEKRNYLTRRDARLPDAGQHRPYDVTPNVAATTAAALNAERSAHRLKNALLSIRKEPLLNTTAAAAPPAPSVFKTPQKAATSSGLSGFAFQTPISGSLFAEAPTMSASELPDWNLPEDNFNPTEPANLPSRTRGETGRRKHPSVPLKRTQGTGAVPVTPPPADFDWGPLPSFVTPPPANSLPTSFFSFSTPKK